MFAYLLSLFKDFFWWLYWVTQDMPAYYLSQLWALLPEPVQTSNEWWINYLRVADYWFPLHETMGFVVSVTALRVSLFVAKTVWKFVPVLGA